MRRFLISLVWVLPVMALGTMLPTVKVSPGITAEVSPLLFGGVLEGGNARVLGAGVDGADLVLDPETGEPREEIVRLLRRIDVPAVQFPGNEALRGCDPLAWAQLITQPELDAPGQKPRFGYFEFFTLAEELGWKTILPINFQPIVAAKTDEARHQAILDACGVLAYASSPESATLPEGMPAWPAVRAANGRSAPFTVDYVRIGGAFEGGAGQPETAAAARHIQLCLLETIAMLRVLQLDVPVIVDAALGPASELSSKVLARVFSDPAVREAVSFLNVDLRRPGELERVEMFNKPVELNTVDGDRIWYAMVSAPDIDETGQATLDNGDDAELALVASAGEPLVVSQWNWDAGTARHPVLDSRFAQGHASAGVIHAMLRHGGVALGMHASLLGDAGAGSAIRAPADSDPFLQPVGEVLKFYRENVGSSVFYCDIEDATLWEQPLRLGELEPAKFISTLDAVATGDERTVSIHLINRHFRRPQHVDIDLSDFVTQRGVPLQTEAEVVVLEGSLLPNPEPTDSGKNRIILSKRYLQFDPMGRATVELPARSLVVIKARR
ncbi:MAG: hypothetical protein ACQKBV_12350 [Puniceicoccales bacterium]